LATAAVFPSTLWYCFFLLSEPTSSISLSLFQASPEDHHRQMQLLASPTFSAAAASNNFGGGAFVGALSSSSQQIFPPGYASNANTLVFHFPPASSYQKTFKTFIVCPSTTPAAASRPPFVLSAPSEPGRRRRCLCQRKFGKRRPLRRRLTVSRLQPRLLQQHSAAGTNYLTALPGSRVIFLPSFS
jgi:hypothetical protein